MFHMIENLLVLLLLRQEASHHVQLMLVQDEVFH